MQKKNLYRLAAALLLAAAVAVILMLTMQQKSRTAGSPGSETPSSAMSEEMGIGPASSMADSASVPDESSSAEEAGSESFADEPAAVEEASSTLKELEEELKAERVSASSVSSAAKPESGSTAASSGSLSAPSHSQTSSSASAGPASSSHPSSVPESHPSSTVSSESAVDAQINEYVKQLEKLRDQTESKLYGVIYEAYNEYISHPAEERSMTLKISIVVSKTAKLTSVQSECDKEFNALLAELRQYLRDNGRNQSVADQAEQEYKTLKSNLTSEMTSIVYNSAVGSGDGAKWIQKNIEHKK